MSLSMHVNDNENQEAFVVALWPRRRSKRQREISEAKCVSLNGARCVLRNFGEHSGDCFGERTAILWRELTSVKCDKRRGIFGVERLIGVQHRARQLRQLYHISPMLSAVIIADTPTWCDDWRRNTAVTQWPCFSCAVR